MTVQELGRRIKNHRVSSGLTQADLAKKLMLAPQTVSKWERGVSEPDIALLPEIALFFGVSVDELFILKTHGDNEEALSALDFLCAKGKWSEMAEMRFCMRENSLGMIGYVKGCYVLLYRLKCVEKTSKSATRCLR